MELKILSPSEIEQLTLSEDERIMTCENAIRLAHGLVPFNKIVPRNIFDSLYIKYTNFNAHLQCAK